MGMLSSLDDVDGCSSIILAVKPFVPRCVLAVEL